MSSDPSGGTHTLTFGGTATTLLRLGRFTLLTDPNFLHRGQRAYLGKGLWSRRLTDPALSPADLPELDAIVLSHLHGDHFDRIARRELGRDQPVLTTPAAARRLSRWGFVTEGLRDWQRVHLTKGEEELVVEAVPGVHARGLLAPLLPPVMGSVFEHRVAGVGSGGSISAATPSRRDHSALLMRSRPRTRCMPHRHPGTPRV